MRFLEFDFKHPIFNAALGACLVAANGVLFHLYFFNFEVSEDDKTRYTVWLAAFLTVLLLLLARASAPPFRKLFFVLFGLSLAGSLLLGAAYAYLLALAASFRN